MQKRKKGLRYLSPFFNRSEEAHSIEIKNSEF